jgi:hypothetical protein
MWYNGDMEITDWIIAASAFATLLLAGAAYWTIVRQRGEKAQRVKIKIANEIYKWAEEGNTIFHQIRF